MSSDTKFFDMRCCDLTLSLQIAFGTYKATHYKNDDNKRLIFAWHESAGEGFVPFLVPITAAEAEPLVRAWLKDSAEYGPEEDTDGHCSRSWRVYCENWGHINHNFYTFAAVEPYWAVYGK